MAKPKNGFKKTVHFLITSINIMLNSKGKVSIKCEEGIEQNDSGLFQMSEAALDNLADKVGATGAAMLRNAIATSFDDNRYSVECTWNEKGKKVLDQNGKEIMDTSTGKAQVFKISHWGTNLLTSAITLGADARGYINRMNELGDIEAIRDANKERANRKLAAQKAKLAAEKLSKEAPEVDAEATEDEKL